MASHKGQRGEGGVSSQSLLPLCVSGVGVALQGVAGRWEQDGVSLVGSEMGAKGWLSRLL